MARKGGRARGRRSGPSRELVKAARPGGLGAAQLSPSGARQTSAQTTSLVDAVQGMTRAALNSATPNAYAPVENLPRDPLDNGPFGPLWPLMVQAINPPRTDTGRPEPRVWEYPTGFNLPGSGDRLIPWATLRAASVNVDIIRRCIEIRKDDVRALKWTWRISEDAVKAAQEADPATPRDEIEAGLRKKYAADIARLTKMWQRPWITNGVRFGQWVAAVMDDHITLDGVAVYPVTTVGGQVVGFRVVDATTIKLLINDLGERPQPPYPAFQQKLEGFPRGEYLADVVLNEDGTENVDNGFTASQITYWRENFRTYTPYGFSQVEQALVSAALYLKRQGWMHAEYDEGSTPLTWLVPQGDKFTANQLSPMQRREYETAINDDLEGQTGKRHRIKVSYPGFVPTQMDSVDEQYKPDYDLFLLKLVASHLGVTLDRLGFTEAKGLGASGQHERQAEVQDDSGVNPDAAMLTDLIMELSRNYLDCPEELVFEFFQKKTEDEAAKDAIWAARRQRGAASMNEDRKANGLTPWDTPEADMPSMVTATGIVYIEGGAEQQAAMQELAKNPPTPAGPGGPPGSGRPGSGAGGSGPKPTGPKPTPRPGGGPAPKNKAAAAGELAGYRRWLRKQAGRIPVRPFRFEHADPADLAGHELDGRFQEFDGYEWRQDITKDWRSWNTEHPLHPRGPHGRFVKIGNLVDELKRVHGPLSEHHENALDEAVRRTHAGKPIRRGESSLTDDLVHRGLLEEMPDRKDHFQVSEAGRRHLVARTPQDYGHEPAGVPVPVQPEELPPVDIHPNLSDERLMVPGWRRSAAIGRNEPVPPLRAPEVLPPEPEHVLSPETVDTLRAVSGDSNATFDMGASARMETLGLIRRRRGRGRDRVASEFVLTDKGENELARHAGTPGTTPAETAIQRGRRQAQAAAAASDVEYAAHAEAGMDVIRERGRSSSELAALLEDAGTPDEAVQAARGFAEGHGLTRIGSSGEGALFDPRHHEALPGLSHKPGEPVMVAAPGYTTGEAVVRRATVVGAPSEPVQAPTVEDAVGQGAADRLRQAEIMYGSDRSQWPARAKRDAQRLERQAAREQRSVSAAEPPVSSGQVNDSSGTVEGMTEDEWRQSVRAMEDMSPTGAVSDALFPDDSGRSPLRRQPEFAEITPESIAAESLAAREAKGPRANVRRKPRKEVHEGAYGAGVSESLFGKDGGVSRLERQDLPSSAAEPSASGGQVIDLSGTVEGMATPEQSHVETAAELARIQDEIDFDDESGGTMTGHERNLLEERRDALRREINQSQNSDVLKPGWSNAAKRRTGRTRAWVESDPFGKPGPGGSDGSLPSDAPGLTPEQREILQDLEGRRADAEFERLSAPRPEPRDMSAQIVREQLNAMNSREQAAAYLDVLGLKASDLRQLAIDLGMTVGARDSKIKIRNAIVESRVGFRLNSPEDSAARAALSAFGVEQSNRLEELRRIPRGAPDRAALLAERTALQRTRQAALDATAELSRRHGSPVDRILRNLSDTMDEIKRENATGLTKAAGADDEGKA
jgi:DNA-binding MarR family transcriptional regulator